MNFLQGMNQAVSYLEDHMQGEIDYQKAAEFTGYSSMYFQRIFACIAQITVAEYVRKRRMTLVAADLKNSNIRILDLALQYGYDSADAFFVKDSITQQLQDYSLSEEGLAKWFAGGEGVKEVVPLGYAGDPVAYQKKIDSMRRVFDIMCTYAAERIMK